VKKVGERKNTRLWLDPTLDGGVVETTDGQAEDVQDLAIASLCRRKEISAVAGGFFEVFSGAKMKL